MTGKQARITSYNVCYTKLLRVPLFTTVLVVVMVYVSPLLPMDPSDVSRLIQVPTNPSIDVTDVQGVSFGVSVP